jgi:ABC-type transport system substrate-binding protein
MNSFNTSSFITSQNGIGSLFNFKRFSYWGLISGLFLMLSLTLIVKQVSAVEEKPSWKWTQDHPKPEWWYWGDKYEESKPVRGGYLHQAAVKYVGLLNPNHWPVNDWTTITNIYEPGIYTNGDFRITVNWLFESWKFTGPKSAVVKLKKGIKFHDGAEFTAEGFKYQIDWVKNPKNGAWTRSFITPIVSVKVVDKHTLKFTFDRPWSSFAGMIGFIPGYAISPKALKADVVLTEVEKLARKVKTGRKKIAKLQKKAAGQGGSKAGKIAKKIKKEQKKLARIIELLVEMKAKSPGAAPLDQHGVGTGRFMFEKAQPGNYIKLKRNPNWWFGQSIGKPEMPYFDGIHVSIIPDITVQLANLRVGKIDDMAADPTLYNLMKKDPKLIVHLYPLHRVSTFIFNHAKGPMKDIRVRKAISHAIDRRALIHGTQFGLATVASSVFPEYHWCHNPNLKPVTYDPELSKKLLAEAGYADGLSIKGFTSNEGNSQTVALAAKNMLRKVNIDWEFDLLEPAAIADVYKNLEYDFAARIWPYISEPDVTATGMYHPSSGLNSGRSNNKKAVTLIEKARNELDENKRRQLYWELEKTIYDNYEDVWLWWPTRVWVSRKVVKGFNVPMYLQGRDGYLFSHPKWFENGTR